MKTALLPASIAVLSAMWPIFLWIMNLNGRILSTAEAQGLHEHRIELVEKATGDNFKEMRDFLEKVDRRLSRIEGRLSSGREWRDK